MPDCPLVLASWLADPQLVPETPPLFHTVIVPSELNLIRVSPVYWQPGKFTNWLLLSGRLSRPTAWAFNPFRLGLPLPRWQLLSL